MAEDNQGLRLPSIPKDCYYEDYVAAILNAGGYYLDRSVHRRKNGVDLLELDVVATRFEPDKAINTIIEVKSGGWGIKDLFKVKGWLDYLQLTRAAFIYQETPEGKDEVTMQTVAKELGIDLLSNSLNSDGTINDTAILDSFGIHFDDIPSSVIRAFRYSYALERVMLDFIHGFSKENPQFVTPIKVYSYFRSLVDETFFKSDPIKRLNFLTTLSLEHKNIACVLDKELKGQGVLDPNQCSQFDNLFEIENPSTMSLRPVDVALYVQLLNRLYVFKAMVEYLVQPVKGEKTQEEEWIDRLGYLGLTSNITLGIDRLKTHPHFYLYPFFFQVFFFVFGGFIMKAKEDEEYGLLSVMSGLPKEEIDLALGFWDELYPLSKSWMKTMNHGGLFYMQFVPVPLRGVGVNFRRFFHAPENVRESEVLFDNLRAIAGIKCFNDMIHWNNAAWMMLSLDRNLHQRSTSGQSKFEKHILSVDSFVKSKGYMEIRPLSEIATSKNCKNFVFGGYLCIINDELYDLYIVKPNDALISFPINQVVKDLRLNQGFLRHCYVMGTDERKTKDENDTIWFTCTVHNSSLSHLQGVLEEAEKLN